MKLEDASCADYVCVCVCICLAPPFMKGCTSDAPIPARTWVWTGSRLVLLKTNLNIHTGFIYLNPLTAGCQILLPDVLSLKKTTSTQVPFK